MKLGLAISGRRPTGEAIELAMMAERMGFAEVWLTEDYCERGAFAVAGAIAASTRRVAVGLGVVNPWTRHPMLTAMETAALAELAPGRLIMGLGASNPRWMQDQLGIAFAHPLSVLEDAVDVLRQALTGREVHSGDGRFDVDAQLAFVPPEPIPIVLGVKGPNAVELAGRIADGILLSVLSSPAYVRWVRERAPDVELRAYIALRCSDDHTTSRDQIRPFVATFLGIHGDHPITRIGGLEPDRAEQFRRGWLAGTPRTDLVDDRMLDEFVVAGDTAHCAAALRRFAEAGLETAVIHDQQQEDMESYLRAVLQTAKPGTSS